MNHAIAVRLSLRTCAVAIVAVSLGACTERATNPANALPYGYVDAPRAGDVLRPGKTLVGGWALDDSRVAEIRVFLDGHYRASAPIAVPRPDVAKAFPQCGRQQNICGFNLLVDFGMAAGEHIVLVQAIDDYGASRDIGAIPVVIPR